MMQLFLTEAQKYTNLPLNFQQQKAFEIYESELMNWNEKMNLTAIRDLDGIRVKHFLDSLTCLSVMKPLKRERVIDIGTGAGFPGIPLKIICPGIKLTLVESIGKKATFCKHILKTLKMDDVEVLPVRAEEAGHMPHHRAQYDWSLARAVATLPILSEYLLPFLKVGGSMLAQKGETAHAEAQASENAIGLLGGELQRIEKIILPGVVEERFLVVVKKITATPPQYPRNVGVPAKKPL